MNCDICKKPIPEGETYWFTRSGDVTMVACEGCEFGAFAHPPAEKDAARQSKTEEP